MIEPISLYTLFYQKAIKEKELLMHNHQKKIALINDFCGFGRCSITVSLPIISALKIQCCPIPTSIFSNHTAYDSFYRTDYTEHMAAYMKEWEKLGLHFQGILIGYLASYEQIRVVREFIEYFKRPDTLCILDPVMGDNGTLYHGYSPQLAENMRELIPYADLLTPNLTEACILTDTPYRSSMNEHELLVLAEKLSKLGPKQIVISGLDRGQTLDNFIYEAGRAPDIVSSVKVGSCRCGTGDIFSSILAADAVNKMPLTDSVNHACSFLQKALKKTVELAIPPTDGICFEECLDELM